MNQQHTIQLAKCPITQLEIDLEFLTQLLNKYLYTYTPEEQHRLINIVQKIGLAVSVEKRKAKLGLPKPL